MQVILDRRCLLMGLLASALAPRIGQVVAAGNADIAGAVDFINNTRLSQFQLRSVSLLAFIDRNTVAIYEMVRKNGEPVVVFKPEVYLLNQSLRQDPKNYKVEEFCNALHLAPLPTGLKYVDLVRTIGGDLENELFRMAREGLAEAALATLELGSRLIGAGYRVQATLLGTAERRPPKQMYSTPAAHYAFGVAAKAKDKFTYRDAERSLNFNGMYYYEDIIFVRRNF